MFALSFCLLGSLFLACTIIIGQVENAFFLCLILIVMFMVTESRQLNEHKHGAIFSLRVFLVGSFQKVSPWKFIPPHTTPKK